MSTQELERLDVKLGQEVLYYHYHNKTVNADTLDKLREIKEEIMEEESSYLLLFLNVCGQIMIKRKELSGEVEVSEEKESLEEINGIAELIPATNFHITDDELGQGTPKEKFRANIMAIQLLKNVRMRTAMRHQRNRKSYPGTSAGEVLQMHLMRQNLHGRQNIWN